VASRSKDASRLAGRPDADGDQIPDHRDACPDDPEDLDRPDEPGPPTHH
jgi:hypothetical protein